MKASQQRSRHEEAVSHSPSSSPIGIPGVAPLAVGWTSSSMHRPSCRSWSSRLAYGCSRRCSKKIGLPCVAPGMRISRPGTRIAPAMLRAKSSWAGIKSRSVGPECGATAWRCRCPRPRRSRDADPLNRRVVDQMLIGVATRQYAAESRTAGREHHDAGHQQECGQSTLCGADPGAAGRVARDTARRAGTWRCC